MMDFIGGINGARQSVSSAGAWTPGLQQRSSSLQAKVNDSIGIKEPEFVPEGDI